MAGTFNLKLLTPYCNLYEAEVQGVMLPGVQGEFGVLSNHTKFASALKPGAVRIVEEGQTSIFAISGGFAEISDQGVMVLADSAEKTQDIDLGRAEESKHRAETELSSLDVTDEAMKERLENRIARADNRIKLTRSR